MRVATIDIGTNTVLLLIAETRGADLVAVEERATITRLGQGVDRTRQLAPEAIARTIACLDEYADAARARGVDRVAVVGTSAMRDAGGGSAVAAHVAERFGVAARVIGGVEEARLAFHGALTGLGPGATAPHDPSRVAVFDIGGGSTEIVIGDRRTMQVERADSADVGSVRLTERLVHSDPPSPRELESVTAAAREAIVPLVPPQDGATRSPLVGIAGTMTTLAAVSLRLSHYDASRVHGLELSRATVERVVNELAAVDLATRRALPGIEPKRADVIVAGGLIALAVLDAFGSSHVTVSDRGVRWGLAWSISREEPDLGLRGADFPT